ncbi:hypothetical protein JAAARDRAFT_41083 [Jaapia argillacea MUCL 33604]|uniref:Aminotransferase class V domain-containing protein n=1 Tax=Jaapia argillacea MUCL 33604 TaxID=933084 RepID=A0A067P9H2_9AGAM|nr:hypothetical protein JAAARDRAFT_41083 [Jaapia argillacea MUCL 33604]
MSTARSDPLDVAYARSQFPSLANGYIFADNAGGSQILQPCIDKLTDYLVNSNVQLGADYSVSVESTKRVNEGKLAVAKLFGITGSEKDAVESVVLGSSSTLLVENLARAMEGDIRPGDEFIITGEHEANAGPWKKLAARRGGVVRYWPASPISSSPNNPYAVSLKISDLLPLITPNTRLVAFTACSNILGSVIPVKEVVEKVRERAKELGARKVEISVDCVAYAPHRRIRVEDWGVDYCFFSLYKTYGPHISALYTRPHALSTSIASLAHHFLPTSSSPITKLQPGGPGYELVYATTAVTPYLLSLSPVSTSSESDRLDQAFDVIKAHEQILVRRLLSWLESKERWERGVRVVGESLSDLTSEGEAAVERRVPTISFVIVGERNMGSKDVVKVFDQKGGIGIRYGHFYAYTLVEELKPKLDIDDAVVRISLVHYNTVEEVDRIIEILSEVFAR